METLSPDNLFEIALNTPFNELVFLCKTNKQFGTLCQDDNFWKRKTQSDFPNIVPVSGVKYLDRYLSAKYINSGDNLKTELEQAITDNNIRLTMILAPLVIKNYRLYQEFLTVDHYIVILCELAITAGNYAILAYLIGLLEQVAKAKSVAWSHRLIIFALENVNYNMIKFIINYYTQLYPNYLLPVTISEAAMEITNDPEILKYLASKSVKVKSILASRFA